MVKSNKKMGLVFFPAFDWAISPTHPEREERLLYTQDQVLEEGLLDIDGIIELRPSMADFSDIDRVHICIPQAQKVTTVSHLLSAGGAMAAADAVMTKKVDCAFALVRPPGHHAMRVVCGARGFCNVNMEAIMVEHIRHKYGRKRVAIVDTDCHHGDGTQDIYWHDPETLFISLHQDGRTLYPGTGFIPELGGTNAMGTTINIPLPPHTSEEGFIYVTENIILPILKDFQPDLVINSAGQDNHYADPITDMNFSAQGYAHLTSLLQPDIAVLEGGYSIEDALPYVNVGIILAMAGLSYEHVKEPDYDPVRIRQSQKTTEYIKEISEQILCLYGEAKCRRDLFIRERNSVTRERRIYYDTDDITEIQKEEITVCDKCAGTLVIDSRSDKGNICAVVIPRDACESCTADGRERFARLDRQKYDYVYLQDRVEDNYIREGRK
ncbi:MAG: histone deacetylase [Deltaproteobacteria bacterium]|nr:histone deacetylase [Deltaproteobacteria bacterium]